MPDPVGAAPGPQAPGASGPATPSSPAQQAAHEVAHGLPDPPVAAPQAAHETAPASVAIPDAGQLAHEQAHATPAAAGKDPQLDKGVKALEEGERQLKHQLDTAPEPAKPTVRTNEEARELAKELTRYRGHGRGGPSLGGH